jgi:hypothetical protein
MLVAQGHALIALLLRDDLSKIFDEDGARADRLSNLQSEAAPVTRVDDLCNWEAFALNGRVLAVQAMGLNAPLSLLSLIVFIIFVYVFIIVFVLIGGAAPPLLLLLLLLLLRRGACRAQP